MRFIVWVTCVCDRSFAGVRHCGFDRVFGCLLGWVFGCGVTRAFDCVFACMVYCVVYCVFDCVFACLC